MTSPLRSALSGRIRTALLDRATAVLPGKPRTSPERAARGRVASKPGRSW